MDQYFLGPVEGSDNVRPILVKYFDFASSTSLDP